MKFKKDDLVKISDGSFAFNILTGYNNCIGLSKDIFIIEEIFHSEITNLFSIKKIHNVLIRKTMTGELYLHSLFGLKFAEPVL